MEKRYIPIIGMEVHVELKTASKMFSPAKNDPDASDPNRHINPIDLGHPGTLPVPNKQAIAWTVLIGKALGCSIREVSKFDRKHYFYPDLPKGYQISQYDEPIAEKGAIDLFFPLEDNHRDHARIGIERAHLEEDTAKLTHTEQGTVVDFNRAGIPLVEIVTHPDFESAAEAKIFCQELQLILRTLGVSDADLEKGHMRCEANVSVQEAGQFEIRDGVVSPLASYSLNNKVEVKNINSFKAVERAIAFEIQRQTALLQEGKSWDQQTRGWNDELGETVAQRKKESAADYRYFPEPDIPPFHPLEIAGKQIIPELPIQKRMRFKEEYGFSYADAAMLTASTAWADFTEAVMSELHNWIMSYPEFQDKEDSFLEEKKTEIARLAGGWMTSKLNGQLKERNREISSLMITPENFAEFISLIFVDRINSTNAQKLLADMLDAETDIDPTHIMEDKGYGQVQDEGALEIFVERVIRSYPDQVKQFRDGKEPIIKFLVGMVMRESEGSADPVISEEMLRKKLAE